MSINVFYPSLKVRVKVVSVNMKSNAINVVFVTIFLELKLLNCVWIVQEIKQPWKLQLEYNR